MANSLGEATYTLTANGSGLSQGLDKAAKDIKQFGDVAAKEADKVDARLAKMGQSAGSGLSSAFGGLSRMAGPAMAGIGVGVALGTAVVAGMSAVVVSGASKLWDDALEKMTETVKVGRIAEALGVNKVELSKVFGSWKWAGNDNPAELIEALGQFQGKLRQAVEGAPEAKKAFDLLGLSIDHLARMDPVSQFRAVFDAAAKMGPGGQTVGLVGQIFGTDFAKLAMPMIGRTADELDRLGAKFTVQAKGIAASEIATYQWREATAAVSKEYEHLLLNLGPVVTAVSFIARDMLSQFQTNFPLQNIDWGKIAVEGAYAFGALVDTGKAFGKEVGPVVLNFIDNVADAIECVYLLDKTAQSMGLNTGKAWKTVLEVTAPGVAALIDLSKILADMNNVTPSESPIARRIKEATAASRRFLDTMNTTDPTATARRYGQLAQSAVDGYQAELQRRTAEIAGKKSVAPEIAGGDGGFAEAMAAATVGMSVVEHAQEKVDKLRQHQQQEWERFYNHVEHFNLGEAIERGSTAEYKLIARVDFDRSGDKVQDQLEIARRQLQALEDLKNRPPVVLGVF